ncbi:peptide chain release factor 1-like, mitochondrial [Gasterosteus aculeatus]
MAHRRAAHLLPTASQCVSRLWVPRLRNPPNAIGQTASFLGPNGAPGRAPRSLHTATPSRAAKLLSLDELFAKRSLQEHLKELQAEYAECLKAASSRGDEPRTERTRVSLLAPLVQSIGELDTKWRQLAETETLLTDEDPALRELAQLEHEGCQREIQDLRQKILDQLLPEEEADLSDLVLEVTAGIGGQEAMLFTDEVFDMYQGYARHQGWSFDILEHMTSEIGQRSHSHLSYLLRPLQIGTKGRSEKIRTYNFSKDRVTDHRLGTTVHDVRSFLLGEDLLDQMNSWLQEFSNQEALEELLEETQRDGS